MNKLFNGLDYVRTYIDDQLIISNKSLEDHIAKIDKVLSKLKSAGFKINAERSFFARNEFKYQGLKMIREGIISLPDKVEAIHNITVPTNKKQLQCFLGIIDYYRDMWKFRSGSLTPSSSMISNPNKPNEIGVKNVRMHLMKLKS